MTDYNANNIFVGYGGVVVVGDTVIYIMRGIDLNSPTRNKVVWIVKNTPDFTGNYYTGPWEGSFKNIGEIKIINEFSED
jgi:hypothetical protein